MYYSGVNDFIPSKLQIIFVDPSVANCCDQIELIKRRQSAFKSHL